jgi:hypothetical protein
VVLYVYLPIFARQRLDKNVSAATKNCWRRFLCGSCRIRGASVSLCVYVPLSLLGKGSVNTFPLQRRIVGGVVFCAVHVILKESRPFSELLVLPFGLAKLSSM